MKQVKIAILGLGTVGAGLWSLLNSNRDAIESSTDTVIQVAGVLVRNKGKNRGVTLPDDLLTTEIDDLLIDPEIQIVVELIGGIDPAREYVLRALASGKHVITANKALIAQHGAELHRVAEEHGVSLRYEASVCGGIPVITVLQDYLAAETITGIEGIVNGTTNYILSRMTNAGLSYEQALREAQEAGYAEADPSSDVDGHDAHYKLKILTWLANGLDIPLAKIEREGITGITAEDIRFAKAHGYRIKLLAVAKTVGETLELRVAPALLPSERALARVDDSFNALVIHGRAIGELTLTGQGAGGLPTGSAVLADLISLIRSQGDRDRAKIRISGGLTEVVEVQAVPTRWYLRLELKSRLGEAGLVGQFLAERGVSVASLDETGHGSDTWTIQMMTDRISAHDLRRVISSIGSVFQPIEQCQMIRVEE